MDLAEPFVALVIYPTTPDAQSRHAESLVRIAAEKVRSLPGFLRGRVFVSEDGDSLVTLTEWSDRESFQQFRQSEFGRGGDPAGRRASPPGVLAAPARHDRRTLRHTFSSEEIERC
jgi:heme-degrading monooxygenase HmoA